MKNKIKFCENRYYQLVIEKRFDLDNYSCFKTQPGRFLFKNYNSFGFYNTTYNIRIIYYLYSILFYVLSIVFLTITNRGTLPWTAE